MNRMMLIAIMLSCAACKTEGETMTLRDVGIPLTPDQTTPPPPTSSDLPPTGGDNGTGGGELCVSFLGWNQCGFDLDNNDSGGSTSTGIWYGTAEVEPNNDRDTATVLQISVRGGNEDGLRYYLQGAVDDQEDPHDYFVFTTGHAASVGFQLCDGHNFCSGDESTSHNMDVYKVSFSVMDQDGNVLGTTSGAPDTNNGGRLSFDAGVPYYVLIEGVDTEGTDREYRLRFALSWLN